MQTVERNEYALWCRGILLQRNKNTGIIVNEILCDLADKALLKGEAIGFTVKGKIVSYGVLRDNNNCVEVKNLEDI